ncbi:MAG TPA: hypothetical protein VN903_29200 [Polyangia bacterium]|nr:hypothetical protein [Polyangia bacterium]
MNAKNAPTVIDAPIAASALWTPLSAFWNPAKPAMLSRPVFCDSERTLASAATTSARPSAVSRTRTSGVVIVVPQERRELRGLGVLAPGREQRGDQGRVAVAFDLVAGGLVAVGDERLLERPPRDDACAVGIAAR